jgi:hypothetical protein
MSKRDAKRGESRYQLTLRCCVEAEVGYETARNVLWGGKTNPSRAVKRVLRWALLNGVTIAKPPQEAAREVKEAKEAIADAERRLLGAAGD